jgi:hypothetical protein
MAASVNMTLSRLHVSTSARVRRVGRSIHTRAAAPRIRALTEPRVQRTASKVTLQAHAYAVVSDQRHRMYIESDALRRRARARGCLRLPSRSGRRHQQSFCHESEPADLADTVQTRQHGAQYDDIYAATGVVGWASRGGEGHPRARHWQAERVCLWRRGPCVRKRHSAAVPERRGRRPQAEQSPTGTF